MRRMRDERVRQTNEKARIRRRRRWIDASYGRASWNRYNDCIMMELRFWSLRQRCSSEFIHARQNISWLRRAPAVFAGLCTGDIVLAKIVRLSTLPPFRCVHRVTDASLEEDTPSRSLSIIPLTLSYADKHSRDPRTLEGSTTYQKNAASGFRIPPPNTSCFIADVSWVLLSRSAVFDRTCLFYLTPFRTGHVTLSGLLISGIGRT